MNCVEIKGGLGNQIFQYVFSRYLSVKAGKCCVLHVDFYDYVKSVYGATGRGFDLDKFNTKYISVNGALTCNGVVNEDEMTGADPLVREGTVFYRGYWQDKKYYLSVKDMVSDELKLKSVYIDQKMQEASERMSRTESVSLHIRGTDYLQGQNKEIFAAQGADYYREALARIKEKTEGNLTVFVFTDDMIYAQPILDGIDDVAVEIMPQAEAYQDLWLMSQTKHHVIANSSYSWWGAVLGERKGEEGITVAPEKWFVAKRQPNLYLDNWIVI